MSQSENDLATMPAAGPRPTRRLGPLQRFLLSNEFGLIVLIIVFAAIFWAVSPMFLSKFSLYALGRTAAVNIMIGFAMMVVIVTGGLNLAVGAIGVCAAMAGGWLMQEVGLHWAPALLGGLALGAALGAVHAQDDGPRRLGREGAQVVSDRDHTGRLPTASGPARIAPRGPHRKLQ